MSWIINLVLIILTLFLYLSRDDLARLLLRSTRASMLCTSYSSTLPFSPENPKDESLHGSRMGVHNDLANAEYTTNEYTVDSAEGEPRLTHVIMPHHPSQEALLMENINSWTEHQPCNTEVHADSKRAFKVELVLFSTAERDVLMEKRLLDAFERLPSRVKTCFSGVRAHFASLGREGEGYVTGSRMMFEQMLRGDLNLIRPSHVIYLEPDARPVQRFWLTHLDSICRFPNEPFWMKGSLFRGDPSQMNSHVLYNLFHINGNALYNLSDPSFRYFYFALLRPFIVKYHRPGAYDTDIFKFLLNLGNYDYVRHVTHKFQVTEAIQNWWGSDYDVEELNGENKTEEEAMKNCLFIVHGGTRKG